MGKRIRPFYDDSWILNGLKKHKAKYSMVIHFETSDPERLIQLKDFLINPEEEQYVDYNIFIYDPWNGLGHLDKTKGKVSYDIVNNDGAKFPNETKTEGRGKRKLANALNLMDAKLKNDKTIFIRIHRNHSGQSKYRRRS